MRFVKKFREDLFYRLNVVPIHVPPLRERKEDIHYLIDYFLNEFSIDMGKEMPAINEEAIKLLVDYEWPGNVRIKNLIQRLLFYDEKLLLLNWFRLHWVREHLLVRIILPMTG